MTSTSIFTIDEEGFLHLSLDSTSNLVELAESFRTGSNSTANRSSCEEVRVSLAAQSLGVADAAEHDHPERVTQFIQLLKVLLQVDPAIEKIIFDSGFTNDSNTIPLQAIGEVLSEAKKLKRLDLSYIRVTCHSEEQIKNWQEKLQNNASSHSPLEQCCLDRCSVRVIHADEVRQEDSSLDSLICLFLHGFHQLEWLTICSDAFASLKKETLVDLCRAPTLKELMLWNFDLQGDEHLVTLFDTLTEQKNSSPLVRLTLPSTLNRSGAQAVARYLRRQQSSNETTTLLQGLTLTINQFLDDDKDGRVTQNEVVIQNILGILSNGLRVNQSLQSFRMRGSARIHSQKVFAEMLAQNYTLQYFSILNDSSSDRSKDFFNIQMYLKLNRNGRRRLLLPSDKNQRQHDQLWVDTITHLRRDLNCLFYLLRTNPSILHCNTGSAAIL